MRGMKDDYLFWLTDDTGMLQHAKYGVPNPGHGYTTDDNARALIMAVLLYEKYRKKKYLNLMYRYSSFLLNAQNKAGKFRNFMSYERKWLEEEGSEDCFGRCIWALGAALSNRRTPQGMKDSLGCILKKALPHVPALKFLRAKAYAAVGLAQLEAGNAKQLVAAIAEELCRRYELCKEKGWLWFENSMTYCNSVLPWSLFSAYRVTGGEKFLTTAEESLLFLEQNTFRDGYFKPIGCRGWLNKGGKAAEFDEQPVEAAETALAYLEAYRVTGNKKYREQAQKCHAWYEGGNSGGISLIDEDTGGCFDGLTADGVNLNMGAESQVSYFICSLKISEII